MTHPLDPKDKEIEDLKHELKLWKELDGYKTQQFEAALKMAEDSNSSFAALAKTFSSFSDVVFSCINSLFDHYVAFKKEGANFDPEVIAKHIMTMMQGYLSETKAAEKVINAKIGSIDPYIVKMNEIKQKVLSMGIGNEPK